MTNRHTVDQLADVRSEIRVLRAREEKLRDEVLASGDVTGEEHEATLTRTMVERVDIEAMKRELGMIFLRPYLRTQEVVRVQLKARQRKNETEIRSISK